MPTPVPAVGDWGFSVTISLDFYLTHLAVVPICIFPAMDVVGGNEDDELTWHSQLRNISLSSHVTLNMPFVKRFGQSF